MLGTAGSRGITLSVPALNSGRSRPTALSAKWPTRAETAARGMKNRRFFLAALFGSWFAIGWTALIASLIGMLLGTLRFMFPNVLSEPPSKFKAGFPGEYEPETVVTRYKDSEHTWIVRHKYDEQGDILYALDATCTHLGCTPN